MLGKTLTSIKVKDNGERMEFTTESGESFVLYHDQDCCENVAIDDICGDLDLLLGSPLTMAEEITESRGNPPPGKYSESWTWTFYRLATVRGYVTIRWLGESNGCYSESVYFTKC